MGASRAVDAARYRATCQLMLTAITRGVSPAIGRCELTYLDRREIDFSRAVEQHRRYEECLAGLGARIVSLPADPDYPDSMFVEDPAVVLDAVAVITRMGVESRRGEAASLARALEAYRPLVWMREPATLEGGDVLRMGRRLFVGASPRTNAAGIVQFAELLRPFGYTVQPVTLRGCLHLKSGCSALSERAVLVNREWVDTTAFDGYDLIDVAASEPNAANVLSVGETVVMTEGFPATRRRVEGLGYSVVPLDISELQKAESALTCSSLLFTDTRRLS